MRRKRHWVGQEQSWRKIRVGLPESLEVFSKVQAIYVGADNLLRRLDDDVEIAGNAPGVYYVSDYMTVSGLRFPTKRCMHSRLPDGKSLPGPLVSGGIVRKSGCFDR